MSNLLDKSSIVLTPTAYDNSKVLCVKPSDGSGDFQFSRNSAATRVNAQGLVENVQILSSNLVQNGSFSEEGAEEVSNGSFTNGSTDWTLGTGWSIGEDKAVYDGLQAYQQLRQGTVNGVIGKNYIVKYTVSDNNGAGGIQAKFGGVNLSSYNSSNGSFEFYVEAISTDYIRFTPQLDFNGSVTNISVKEVGQNWSVLNATITDVGNLNGTGVTSLLYQNILTNGKTYKVTFTASDYNGLGDARAINSNGDPLYIITSNGTFTFTFTHTVTNGNFLFRATSGAIYSVDDVSVIEITDDTNLPRINYEGFSYQDALGSEEIVNGNFATDLSGWSSITNVSWSSNFGGSAFMNANGTNAQFRQFITYVVGKTYRISWEVKENNGCDLFRVYNNGGFTNITDNFVGTHTIDFTQTSGTLFLLRNDTIGSNITIDNVSVKEVTGQEVVPDSGCGSWLFEPQTTQLLSYSEDFSQWNAGGDTTIESGYLAPDGTNNAYKISGTTSALTFGASLLTTTTRSIYARTVSGTGQAHLCSFNGNSNNLFTITEQWQRFEVNSATTTGAVNFYAVDFRNQTNLSEIIIWGANATNDQDYATSYIPSNGSTVTRNQDLCTNGGSLASINSTEGTLYFEGSVPVDGTFRTVSLAENNLSSNAIWFYISNQNRIQVNVRSTGNPSVGLASDTTVLAPNENFKVAVKYKVNDIAVWLNGVEIMTDNTASVPLANTLNNLSFKIGTSSNLFFGKTKCVAVWKEALTDAELTALTTI